MSEAPLEPPTATSPLTYVSETPYLLPTQIIQKTPAATVDHTSSPKPATETPIIEKHTSELISVCPSPLEVPLRDFGLENYILLVTPYDREAGKIPPRKSGASFIDLENLIFQSIPDSGAKSGWDLFKYQTTKDNKAILLIYQNTDGTQQQVWQSSLDGKEQQLISEFIFEPLTENQLRLPINETQYILYKDDFENLTEYPIAIYDQVSGEGREFPEFPETTELWRVFILDGIPHLLFSIGVNVDEIYLMNLENFETAPVFRWLWGQEDVTPLYTFFHYVNGKFGVVVTQPYGMNFGANWDLTTIKSAVDYDEIMTEIHLEGPESFFIEGQILEKKGVFYSIDGAGKHPGYIFWI